MKLADLPDVDFINVSADEIQASVFESYKNIVGRSVAKGDPTRLFLLFISDVVIRLCNNQNYIGKQNLLKYAVGDNLDNIAALTETERLPASAAMTTIKITLSEERNNEVIVPAGTRIATADGVYFAFSEAVIVTAGASTATGEAVCTETGDVGNGYLPGEINQIVDPVAYVETMTNTTKSEGGSDEEDDDSLRERAHEAPERFSVAGPEGAYQYHAKSVNSAITDGAVTSPSPGVVNIYPLLDGGDIPGEELLEEIEDRLSDKTIRPLTDDVEVKAPTKASYDITGKYYIDSNDTNQAADIQARVTEAINEYILWQKSKLGRDINPSKLISMVMDAGIKRIDITSPTFTKLENTQVAIADEINVTMAGAEEE